MICIPEPHKGDCNGCPAIYEVPAGYYSGIDLATCPKSQTCPCGFEPLHGRCVRIRSTQYVMVAKEVLPDITPATDNKHIAPDVKELFRKEIAKWKDEDPLFMAYVYGQEAGRKERAPSPAYKILESIPDKRGFVIIGVKEDPDGAFVSRQKALEYVRREHCIRKDEREKIYEKLYNFCDSFKQSIHVDELSNFCDSFKQSIYVDELGKFIESLRNPEVKEE
jgi:hypothetical protein